MCAALCGFIATALLFVRLSRGYQPAESQRKNKRAEICPARLPLSSDLMGRIIAADLLPDLIAARFHRLIVAGAGGLNTLLVIRTRTLSGWRTAGAVYPFQHIQYALAGFNLVRFPSAVLIQAL